MWAYNLRNALDHLMVLNNNLEVADNIEILSFKW